ncbi:hypothetical protein C0033_21520 [Clostridium sp. chh4-2]|uniref:DUF1116 domain-containing protein n=1 Tax=Clostridium sp. chh4-2 TaxID=2067550 RepID=UPI000CCDFA5A|nr:DUF1116 domain-containing protein [Clostridium sp. chh4-2]PNV59861.1 hypothetical protein C0033_21520 [Clostridium sp. chh4-2]
MQKANEIAVGRLMSSEPVLIDVKPAYEVLNGLERNIILHSGPPIEFEQMCEPMKGAVYCALLNEGIAKDIEEAKIKAVDGSVVYKTCHEFGAVGPMTGLTTWSMPLWVVEDRNTGKRSYANISEGSGVGLRFGEYSEKTLNRLKWMERVAAPVFSRIIRELGGIDLAPIMAQGLSMGDELHMRNHATTALILKLLCPHIARTAGEDAEDILKFIGVGNDQFFLNLAMAANKLAADAADGVEGSTMVTAIARNGVDIGIRISGLPGRWFTAPSPVVDGLYFPGYVKEDANPDIGDSAIMEVGGFGGCAMVAAPAIVRFLGAESVQTAIDTTDSMYKITLAEHPKYQIPINDFRGVPCGIDIMKVVETRITPVLNTAIASNRAGVGMVGAGMSVLPIEPFEEALMALAENLGI